MWEIINCNLWIYGLYKDIAMKHCFCTKRSYIQRNCPSPIEIYVSSRSFIRSNSYSSTGNEFTAGKLDRDSCWVFVRGKRELEAPCVDDSFDRRRIHCDDLFSINRTAARVLRLPPTGELPVMELSSKRAQRDRLSRKRDTSGKNVLGMAGRGNIDEPPTCASFHLTDEIWMKMAQCTL